MLIAFAIFVADGERCCSSDNLLQFCCRSPLELISNHACFPLPLLTIPSPLVSCFRIFLSFEYSSFSSYFIFPSLVPPLSSQATTSTVITIIELSLLFVFIEVDLTTSLTLCYTMLLVVSIYICIVFLSLIESLRLTWWKKDDILRHLN